MKNLFFSFIVILGLIGCGDDIPSEIPDCIRAKIKEIKSEGVWNPPAKIYRYKFEDKIVYYIPSRCCDFTSQLLDENCNRICSPDGGFSGVGDGKCPNFFKDRTDEKLIWEDTRGQ